MNAINNKIISRFYVITLNKKPVYVGYTNRPIQQRFNEHKHDKDFDKIEPEIEQIAQLEYEFTWDTNKIDQYANEVNDKECELIQRYHTQNSKYQKANGGGQNWADIKYFVNTNHNNPKFLNMHEADVLKRIENEHNINKYIIGFIRRVNYDAETYMKTFVTGMNYKADIYIKNFIMNINSNIEIYMKDFVKCTHSKTNTYMSSFVSSMNSKVDIYINNFAKHMNSKPNIYMKTFVTNMHSKTNRYIGTFVDRMDSKVDRYMNQFVGSINSKEEIYLKNLVTNMDSKTNIYMHIFVNGMNSKEEIYLKNFISHMH